MPQYNQLKLFTGTSNPPLGQEIADYLGIKLGGVKISRFANGEIYVRFEESIRGADVLSSNPLPIVSIILMIRSWNF